MSSNVEVFGFENENIRGNVWEKYKAKKGVVDRLGIIFSDPKVLFAGNKVHFKDRFFLCKGGYCCDPGTVQVPHRVRDNQVHDRQAG